MGRAVTIGLDIAKSVFQVHGVDAEGVVVIRQKLPRARLLSFFAKLEPCLVGIEACGASHHWARELISPGHEARLMPPSYVKAYLKRQKNDMAAPTKPSRTSDHPCQRGAVHTWQRRCRKSDPPRARATWMWALS